MVAFSAWLAALNTSVRSAPVAADLRACCAATSWVEAVLTGRPYASEDDLLATSDATIRALDDDGLAQALAAHPRIGERAAVTPDVGAAGPEAGWSRQEQSGMNSADDDVRARMAEVNRRYEQRFGHVYLVCATGLRASELLAIAEERLGHDDQTERGVVLTELAKIVRLRLGRLLHPSESGST